MQQRPSPCCRPAGVVKLCCRMLQATHSTCRPCKADERTHVSVLKADVRGRFQPPIAVALTLFVAVLAVRALGTTDLSPVSGIGKASQVWSPGQDCAPAAESKRQAACGHAVWSVQFTGLLLWAPVTYAGPQLLFRKQGWVEVCSRSRPNNAPCPRWCMSLCQACLPT